MDIAGADGAVAVDADYFYTWDPATGTVYLYDHEGTFETSLTLSNGNYGYSLSCFNGYLFVARDAGYATGIWYGYNIRRKLSGSPVMNTKMAVNEKAVFRMQRTVQEGRDEGQGTRKNKLSGWLDPRWVGGLRQGKIFMCN